MKKIALYTLTLGLAFAFTLSPVFASGITVTNTNAGTVVSNQVEADANTGWNTSNGGNGGKGGSTGSAKVGSSHNNTATSGMGGQGGNGGNGGMITTGDAGAVVMVDNTVNSSDTKIKVDCGCQSTPRHIRVTNTNTGTTVNNGVGIGSQNEFYGIVAGANTGDNVTDGAKGGRGGKTGSASISHHADDNNMATSGDGGNGGTGGMGGVILTGMASSGASIVNVINSAITRIH